MIPSYECYNISREDFGKEGEKATKLNQHGFVERRSRNLLLAYVCCFRKAKSATVIATEKIFFDQIFTGYAILIVKIDGVRLKFTIQRTHHACKPGVIDKLTEVVKLLPFFNCSYLNVDEP